MSRKYLWCFMKSYIPIVAALVLLTSTFVFFRLNKNNNSDSTAIGAIPACGPVNTEAVGMNSDGRYITALPGWGDYAYPVSSKSDSSQYFFNQGLSLYYGYHFKEALASFKESARFDPENAMAYWGQALAMGPYYNAAHTYTQPLEISEVLTLMSQHSQSANESEKKLIEAMKKRYSLDGDPAKRPDLNLAYAQALKKLIETNKEARVLYIDAVMLMHAWDFWERDGSAKEWTPELITMCEEVLRDNPRHPGAHHYYIHLTEASGLPQRALQSGEILKDLMPGVPHMVHMSSHAYERSGLYAQGAEVNNKADSNLVNYNGLAKHLNLNTFSPHYYAVQTYCALSGGMYEDAVRYSERCRNSVSPVASGNYDQYLFMLPVLVNVRMGKWQEIFRDSLKIDPQWNYATLLSAFAKGMASVNTGNLDNAKKYLSSLQSEMKDPVLENRRVPFNSPIQIARIADKILEGVIYYAEKKPEKAIASLEEAVQFESQLIYTEPKDWPLPARQYLGACLLHDGQPEAAEKVFREDLLKNPGNGWSLIGLSQSIKTEEASKFKEQVRESFASAEHIPESSVYMNW
jgi:tetratricopeptide (TPR) repeat protein